MEQTGGLYTMASPTPSTIEMEVMTTITSMELTMSTYTWTLIATSQHGTTPSAAIHSTTTTTAWTQAA